MATTDALTLFLQSLPKRSYYEILRVPRTAKAREVKSAFHGFSLLYHPDRHVGASDEVVRLAAEIYKRGVEAYACLSRPPLRERYDRALEDGKLRLDASAVAEDLPAPPPPMRTLETIATTPRGKQHALKADRLIAIGKLDDARVQLVSACQCEPYNGELAERLQALYEALALEPL